MAQFGPRAGDFKSAQVTVAFIAAEKRAGMFKPEEYLQGHPVAFPFLLDEDRSVTRQYGVYHRLGLDAIDIARPATFVVDRARKVHWIYVGNWQFDCPALDDVLLQARSAA